MFVVSKYDVPWWWCKARMRAGGSQYSTVQYSTVQYSTVQYRLGSCRYQASCGQAYK